MKHEAIRLYELAVQRAREGYLKYDHLVREVSVVGSVHWRASNKHGEMVASAPTQDLCERLLRLKLESRPECPLIVQALNLWAELQDIGWGYEFNESWPTEPPFPPLHEKVGFHPDIEIWQDTEGWFIAVGDSGGSSWAVTLYKGEL